MLVPNIAMNPQYFKTLAGNARADFVVSNYPEYGTDPSKLDAKQQRELRRAAETIFASLFTRTPVRAFMVVGHADKALRVPLHKRTQFEQDVSQRRANAGREALLKELTRMAGGPGVTRMLEHYGFGIGNLKPVVAQAGTEEQMRKNRRIEVILARAAVADPHCGVS